MTMGLNLIKNDIVMVKIKQRHSPRNSGPGPQEATRPRQGATQEV